MHAQTYTNTLGDDSWFGGSKPRLTLRRAFNALVVGRPCCILGKLSSSHARTSCVAPGIDMLLDYHADHFLWEELGWSQLPIANWVSKETPCYDNFLTSLTTHRLTGKCAIVRPDHQKVFLLFFYTQQPKTENDLIAETQEEGPSPDHQQPLAKGVIGHGERDRFVARLRA